MRDLRTKDLQRGQEMRRIRVGIVALLVHVSAIFIPPYYWSLMIYIRNLFFGTTLLMCWIQVRDENFA